MSKLRLCFCTSVFIWSFNDASQKSRFESHRKSISRVVQFRSNFTYWETLFFACVYITLGSENDLRIISVYCFREKKKKNYIKCTGTSEIVQISMKFTCQKVLSQCNAIPLDWSHPKAFETKQKTWFVSIDTESQLTTVAMIDELFPNGIESCCCRFECKKEDFLTFCCSRAMLGIFFVRLSPLKRSDHSRKQEKHLNCLLKALKVVACYHRAELCNRQLKIVSKRLPSAPIDSSIHPKPRYDKQTRQGDFFGWHSS